MRNEESQTVTRVGSITRKVRGRRWVDDDVIRGAIRRSACSMRTAACPYQRRRRQSGEREIKDQRSDFIIDLRNTYRKLSVEINGPRHI